MNGVEWISEDVVLACQLVSTGVLALHLLILRPHGAQQDLRLDARIVQDELDLTERLGHISSTDWEIVALHQLLRRIRQNPGSVKLVLERIPALARTAGNSTADEYLGGALDRLNDAGQRYLRRSWPLTGALSPTIASTPFDTAHSDDQDAVHYLPDDFDDAEVDAAFADELAGGLADEFDVGISDKSGQALVEPRPVETRNVETPSAEPTLSLDATPDLNPRVDLGVGPDLAVGLDLGVGRDLDAGLDLNPGANPGANLDPDPDPDPDLDRQAGHREAGLDRDTAVPTTLDADLGPDLNLYPDFDREPKLRPHLKRSPKIDPTPEPGSPPNQGYPADQDTSELARIGAEDQTRDDESDDPESVGNLLDPDWAPAWVDLVQADTPRRSWSLPDRHARPYRPARSSGHTSSRRIEPPDRSSVLPR